MWYISLVGWVEYRVKFMNMNAVENFSNLVGRWGCSRSDVSGREVDATAVSVLRGHVLELAARQYDDEESAFAEIDMLTSSFALLYG